MTQNSGAKVQLMETKTIPFCQRMDKAHCICKGCSAHCIFLIRIWPCANERLHYGNQHGPKGGCIGHLMTCILKYSYGPHNLWLFSSSLSKNLPGIKSN